MEGNKEQIDALVKQALAEQRPQLEQALRKKLVAQGRWMLALFLFVLLCGVLLTSSLVWGKLEDRVVQHYMHDADHQQALADELAKTLALQSEEYRALAQDIQGMLVNTRNNLVEERAEMDSTLEVLNLEVQSAIRQQKWVSDNIMASAEDIRSLYQALRAKTDTLNRRLAPHTNQLP